MLGRAQHFYVVCVVSPRKKNLLIEKSKFFTHHFCFEAISLHKRFFHFLRQLDGQSTWIQKNVTRRHVRIQKNIGSPIWYIRYFRDVAETLKRLYFYIIRD